MRERPDFATEIATVLHVWTAIEYQIVDFVSFVQRSDKGVVMALYINLRSNSARLDMVRRLATKLLTEERQGRLKSILKDLKPLGEIRNKIAHARWAENGAFPDGIIRLPHFFEMLEKDHDVTLWRLRDFQEVNLLLQVAHERLRAFVHEIYQLSAQT